MLAKRMLILLVLFVFPFLLLAQLKPVIQVTGRVMEQVDAKEKGVSGLEILIQGIGDKPTKRQTEKDGSFSFKTLSQSEIRIEIPRTEFALMDPRDGSLRFSEDKGNTLIKILVVSLESNEDLYKKIKQLHRKVEELTLSNQFKDALFENTRDTLLAIQAENQALRIQKTELEQSLAKARQENKLKSDSLSRSLSELNQAYKEIERLEDQVYELLEAKYLKQQSFYDRIVSGLEKYSLILKDMQYQVSQMDLYIKAHQFHSYRTVSTSYNETYSNLKAEYRSLIQGVRRYWENDDLADELAEVYDYVTGKIHEERLFPDMQELNTHLKLSKMKKAKNKAEILSKDLLPLIQSLEKHSTDIKQKLMHP